MGNAAQRCEAVLRARWPDATILVYGHLGDGNIHIVVQQLGWSAGEVEAAKDIVYSITGDMGGSISAEHGIGTERLSALARSRSPAELDVMRAIKAALDPNNILNPGKLLPRPAATQATTEALKLAPRPPPPTGAA